MKNTNKLLPLVTLITLSQAASALELPVVSRYSDASSAELWIKAKADQVPEALLGRENIGGPRSSYSGLFPKAFLQEELFTVCYQDCKNQDSFSLDRQGEIKDRQKDDWNVIEQTNVYYWLSRYFNFLDSHLNFRPTEYLRVMTSRQIKDEDGSKQRNNAFFLPTDVSLSFLPASKSIFFKLMNGKINRSGFDPSVIAHEASHYFFHHLFAEYVNNEIGGLNEGFADYIANIFLEDPKVGLIMLQGNALRDASNPLDGKKSIKTYAPNMEVHDLGERVAYALWQTRQAVQDKEEFDRLVIDAVVDLASNPYSSVHDFKEKIVARLPVVLDQANSSTVKGIWNLTFPGNATKLLNTDFLKRAVPSKPLMGFQVRTTYSEETAKTYNVSTSESSDFSLLDSVKISDSQSAILIARETEATSTPYWVAVDLKKMNVLGVYKDGKIVREKESLKEAKSISKQALQIGGFTEKFVQKLTDYSAILNGQGSLSLAYKVKGVTSKNTSIKYNGEELNGNAIEVEVKKKFFLGNLLGAPDMDKIVLYSVPTIIEGLPEIKGESVIGYKIIQGNGSSSEIILNKYTL